jgi:hypothetical protein
MPRPQKICDCCQQVHITPPKEYEPVPPPRDPIKGRKTPDSVIRAVNKYRKKEYPTQSARKQALNYYYTHKEEILKKRKIAYSNVKEYQQEYQKKYRTTKMCLKSMPFYESEILL